MHFLRAENSNEMRKRVNDQNPALQQCKRALTECRRQSAIDKRALANANQRADHFEMKLAETETERDYYRLLFFFLFRLEFWLAIVFV